VPTIKKPSKELTKRSLDLELWQEVRKVALDGINVGVRAISVHAYPAVDSTGE
jgi:hypothetical protein